MSNHKIARLLIPMATSKRVLKDFARYMKEAHPDNAVHLTALMRYVLSKDKLTGEDFDKEKVFEHLFPNEEYKSYKVAKLYTKVITQAQKYLMNRALNKRPYLKNFLLAESLNDLELEPQAKKKLEENLDNLPDEEEEKFAVSSKSHRKIYFKTEKNLEEKKKNRPHLIAALRDKEIESTICKLKLCCEIIERKLLWGEEYEEGVQEMIDRTLSQIPHRQEVLLIDILAKSALFLQAPTPESYLHLKNYFFDVTDRLFSEKKEILLYLINSVPFVTVETRDSEYFQLFKFGVEKGYFLENGIISPIYFNNTVRMACFANELEWAKKFMQTHSQYLNKPSDLLENIKNMNQCYLLFSEEKYTEVLDKLDSIYLEDYSYGINKYNLAIRSTFELKKEDGREELLKLINGYRSYVNYKVKQRLLSEELREQILNFLKIFNQIIDFPYKNHTKEELLSALENLGGKIIEKKWLAEKIAKLKRY